MVFLGFLVVVFLAGMGTLCYFLVKKEQAQKKEREEEDAAREKERRLKAVQDQLAYDVRNSFSVEPDTIGENYTQNEIVRIVNLLAQQASFACVNQDKEGRGEEPGRRGCERPSWDAEAHFLKKEWSQKKNLALQICPDLKDRLPHFSEFEPLKSYNAEHLVQKRAKQAVK